MGSGALLRAVFRLEGARTVALARLGREAGAGATLEEIDGALDDALVGLEECGVVYPLHDVARRHRLGQDDYVALQLGLLPWHGAGAVAALTGALGEATHEVRLSHAILLLRPGHDDWTAAAEGIAALPVFREGLVALEPRADGDPTVVVTQAVRELLGLGDPPDPG